MVFRWLIYHVEIGLQQLWFELEIVLSGPCLVWLKLCWHKSTMLSHPCLKKLLSLSCPVHSKNRVVPLQHDWHDIMLHVYCLNTTLTLSIYTITGKMFWIFSVSFPRLDSHTSLCKHLSRFKKRLQHDMKFVVLVLSCMAWFPLWNIVLRHQWYWRRHQLVAKCPMFLEGIFSSSMCLLQQLFHIKP